MNARARAAGELRGVHVLAAMLLFFGVVIAINVAFSVVAIRTFPGEDEKRSYMQGLHYNEKLAARAAQAALGWRAVADLEPGVRGATLHVRLVDRAGHPLDGMTVAGVLRRPSTSLADKTLAFIAGGDGVYTAEAGVLADGVWVFHGTSQRDTQHFDIERRMTWRSPSTH